MNKELLQHLIACGYADDAGIAAEVVGAGGNRLLLCVNGEIVTLVNPILICADDNGVTVKKDNMKKVFSDSIDKLTDLKVTGVFGKKVCFTHNGTSYALKVKGGKTLVEYFKLIV
ncbi:MAG: hypothetical protein K2K13_03615 [Clostridiales bacterium]|nr:hypothetical protein [Clostridiales bacterium]